jgi:exopolysaccharide biosynthesis polyprenyl glycosylphosphotransferase
MAGHGIRAPLATTRAEASFGVLVPTARNAVILRAARDMLVTTLAVVSREEAVLQVERAAEAEPHGRFARQLRSRWAWRIGTFLAAVDVAAVLAAWTAVRAPLTVNNFAAVTVVVVVIFSRADLHRSRLELSVLDDLPAYFVAAILAAVTMAGMAAMSGPRALTSQTCLFFGVMCLVFLTTGRVWAYHVVRRLRRSHLVMHPVVIVGSGDVGQRLAGAMLAHPEYGLAPVGFVDSSSCADSEKVTARHIDSIRPVLGNLAALPAVLKHFDVHEVVFAFGAQPDAHLVRLVRACVRMDLQVFVVPRYFELWGADRRARTEVLWGVPLVRLRRWPLRPGRSWIKRAVDVVLASVGLVALSPLLALCAVAVRLEGGPGVVFRQTRVGRNGEPFTLLKFRTMRPIGDEAEQRWSIDGDRRIGRVGSFMRRSSLDELPQLINVLRGHMSMVGPRPERPFFVQDFVKHFSRYGDRHRVATGLTGWAQVNGLRGDTSIADRVTFDNYYIDNWTLWTDVKIMLRTVSAMARRQPSTSGDPLVELASAAEAASNTG